MIPGEIGAMGEESKVPLRSENPTRNGYRYYLAKTPVRSTLSSSVTL